MLRVADATDKNERPSSRWQTNGEGVTGRIWEALQSQRQTNMSQAKAEGVVSRSTTRLREQTTLVGFRLGAPPENRNVRSLSCPPTRPPYRDD